MKAQKMETKGFGANASFNSAKFEVRFTESEVEIVQVLGIDQDFQEITYVKVKNEVFSPLKTDIADCLNLRLKDKGIKKGKWEKTTYVDNLLGKELAVLFWAMNQAKDKSEKYSIFNSWKVANLQQIDFIS